MSARQKLRNPWAPVTYTIMDELMASPLQPMPAEKRRHQLTRMWDGLVAMQTAPEPTPDNWRVVSDAVNLMETFIRSGPWRDCEGATVFIEDQRGLLNDAVTALALAGQRRVDHGQAIRMDGPGLQATRAILEDYAALLDALPHRSVIQCHRMTERRIRKVLAGIKQPHDIEVIDL